jgi:hypothetical protein
VLAERKLRVHRPRPRGTGGEVVVPADERLHDILMTGVSARRSATVLPAMTGTARIKKSRVSRRLIQVYRQALEKLSE